MSLVLLWKRDRAGAQCCEASRVSAAAPYREPAVASVRDFQKISYSIDLLQKYKEPLPNPPDNKSFSLYSPQDIGGLYRVAFKDSRPTGWGGEGDEGDEGEKTTPPSPPSSPSPSSPSSRPPPSPPSSPPSPSITFDCNLVLGG